MVIEPSAEYPFVWDCAILEQHYARSGNYIISLHLVHQVSAIPTSIHVEQIINWVIRRVH